jgi:hypothetical protein
MEHIVAKAKAYGVRGLIIDQLSHIDAPDLRAPRYLQIRDMMLGLKRAVSTGRDPLPVILAHQMNRDGIREAAKAGGRILPEHLGEGSYAEQTAHAVYGLWQTEEQKAYGQAIFETVATRGRAIRHWLLNWEPEYANFGVVGEHRFETMA